MSTTTLNLPHRRFVAQVSTGAPRSKSTWLSLMAENLEALKECPWREAADGEVELTPHDFTRPGYFSDLYDAYKMTGNYDSSDMTEIGYAGMAAYRFKVPDDATTRSIALSSVALPISRDRFLLGGVRIAAVLSADDEPSTDWSVVRGDGEGALVEKDVLKQTAANLLAGSPGAETVEIDLSGLASGNPAAYLWVYVTLEDYTDHWPMYNAKEQRLYAIEGSAMLVGGSATVTFTGDVTPDAADGRVIFSSAGVPSRTGDATGVFATMRLGNGDGAPFGDNPPQVAAADSAAGLNACYADFLLGRMAPVPPAMLGALPAARPGAGITLSYEDVTVPGGQLGRDATVKAWRLATSALVAPVVLSGPASAVILSWVPPAVAGASLRVWLVPGAYMEEPELAQLSHPAIYTAAGTPPDGWTILGTASASAGAARFSLPPLELPQLATFVLTAWLPPEAAVLREGVPQGAGELHVNVLDGSAGGFDTLVTPTISIA